MSGCHHCAGPVAKQHRQAVGCHHYAGLPGLLGAGRIGIRCPVVFVADGVDCDAVHLVEPVEGPGDLRRLLQAGTVGLDPCRLVPHVGPQVETGEDPFAQATIPGGRQGPDIARSGPVGFNPVHL
ncbi:hypothetical protein D3C86_1540170 [compost metagenome]